MGVNRILQALAKGSAGTHQIWKENSLPASMLYLKFTHPAHRIRLFFEQINTSNKQAWRHELPKNYNLCHDTDNF